MKSSTEIFIAILILFSSISYSQDTCFTQEEVLGITNGIKKLQRNDSLRILLVDKYRYQIHNYENLHYSDSLITSYKDQQISVLNDRIILYKKLVKESKTKWYEKPGYFVLGASMILVGSYVVKNTQ